MEEQKKHPFKARLFVGILMLVFAFLGVIVTDIWRDGSWNYWRVMSPVFAVLSLWLSWYMRKGGKKLNSATIWHELAQWAGLIGAVYLMSGFVHIGLVSRFEASLQVLVMLALTVFVNGIYTEHSFIVIGLLLGLLAGVIALINQYLFAILIPVAIVGVTALVWMFHRARKKESRESSNDEDHKES